MPGLISNLIDVLNEQAEHYEQLHALSLEKKDAIIKNELDLLQKITTIENILVSKNQKLDRKTTSLREDIAHVLNKKESELNLSALIAVIEGQPEHADLVKAGDRLRSAISALKEANDQNKILIHSALDYIDYTMNVLRSTMEEGPSGYGSDSVERNHNKGFFDAKQ